MVGKITLVSCLTVLLVSFSGDVFALQYKSSSVKQEGSSYLVDVQYPQIIDKTLSEEVQKQANQAIFDFVHSLFAEDLTTFQDASAMYIPEDWTAGKDLVDIKYKMIFADKERISIRFEKYFYGRGAAHGFRVVTGFNYDLKNAKPIKLADLFEKDTDYLKQVSDYCIADLNRRLGLDAKNTVEGGAGPLEENLKEFGFSRKHLIVYFSDYQVACYAAGTQEVKIPLKKLAGFKRAIPGAGSHNMIAKFGQDR